MGIKLSITKLQLPIRYQKYRLIPTANGVMSTVYLLDNLYVLKIFDRGVSVESEISILNSLKNLSIPKVIDRFQIDGLEAIVYNQIKGEIVYNPNLNQIRELGNFLQQFHRQSSKLEIKTQSPFSKKQLKSLILFTGNRSLLKIFNSISLTLQDDGIIHGDIFMDNCKFIGDRLSGVYDFSNASLGDFHFDLAVISMNVSFVQNGLDINRVKTLLSSYGSNIDIELFKYYIKYALLYYATIRYIGGREYGIFLKYIQLLKKHT